MNFVDIVVVAAAILAVVTGWRNGFIRGVSVFVGFLGGGLLGVVLAPFLLSGLTIEPTYLLALTFVLVVGLAILGQYVVSKIGSRVSDRITVEPARIADALGGSVLNVTALVVMLWVVAAGLTAIPDSTLARHVHSSVLLQSIDRLVPSSARDMATQVRGLVNSAGLPQLFDSFGFSPPPPVDLPPTATANEPAVRRALESVVKVTGTASECNQETTGSGFVVGPGRVMTNAHVIAGVSRPVVTAPGRWGGLRATPIYFDPELDLAVLDVPGLEAASLRQGPAVSRGAESIIAGYPGGGNLQALPARVRGVISSQLARGTDIYGNPGVGREIYALQGRARPGNSGGPMLSTDGQILGVIFAQAQDDPNVAYALTAKQARGAFAAAAGPATPVGVGSCNTR